MRVPLLSVAAAILACIGALISLALGFLIFGEGIAGFVPNHWVAAFLASSLGTFVLLIGAMVSGRRVLGLRAWRSAWDARFFWESILSTAAAVAFGVAVAFSDATLPALLFWASVFAAYVILARWTWCIWRVIESLG